MPSESDPEAQERTSSIQNDDAEINSRYQVACGWITCCALLIAITIVLMYYLHADLLDTKYDRQYLPTGYPQHYAGGMNMTTEKFPYEVSQGDPDPYEYWGHVYQTVQVSEVAKALKVEPDQIWFNGISFVFIDNSKSIIHLRKHRTSHEDSVEKAMNEFQVQINNKESALRNTSIGKWVVANSSNSSSITLVDSRDYVEVFVYTYSYRSKLTTILDEPDPHYRFEIPRDSFQIKFGPGLFLVFIVVLYFIVFTLYAVPSDVEDKCMKQILITYAKDGEQSSKFHPGYYIALFLAVCSGVSALVGVILQHPIGFQVRVHQEPMVMNPSGSALEWSYLISLLALCTFIGTFISDQCCSKSCWCRR